MLRTAAVSCALLGCAYKPGSFVYGPGYPGERATIGCLDVAVDRRADHDASAILAYRFGNRCDRPIEIDLVRTAVVGRLADGTELALAPYDPELELRVVRLAGRLSAIEALAYPTPQPVSQVCVDVASVVHQQPARWLCLGSRTDVTPGEPDDLAVPASGATVTAEVTP